MSRSMSNLGSQSMIPEEQMQGKGKAPAQSATLTTPQSSNPLVVTPSEDPQGHLEASRANINPVAAPSSTDFCAREPFGASSPVIEHVVRRLVVWRLGAGQLPRWD